MIFIFFMVWRIVIACNEAGCTVSSPEALALLAVGSGVELIIEIKSVLGIYKKKDK